VPADFIYYDTVTYYTYVFSHSEPLDSGATYSFLWDFEGVGTRSGRKEVITFPSADTFLVSLTVSDNFGCTSTTRKSIVLLEEISVQNVFTPNGDNSNDYFMVNSEGGFLLKLRIFSRAGILVYESEGTNLLWDGYSASGQQLNPGVYFYTIEALEGDPKKSIQKQVSCICTNRDKDGGQGTRQITLTYSTYYL
jgi:gliding motility-associated-like protein